MARRRGTAAAGRGALGRESSASAGRLTIALRSADPGVIASVREVVSWLEGELLVCLPGAAPVPAHAHVDAWGERQQGDPSWGSAAILVEAVVDDGRPPTLPPSGRTSLRLPEQEGELADALSMRAAAAASVTVGVVGVKGGVGASVTAALLARSASEVGRSTGLVDLCGGLDVALGVEDVPGPRWADLTAEAGPFPASTLIANLPRWARVSVLAADARGTPAGGDLGAVLASVGRACRVVVLDLPRTVGVEVARRCDVLIAVAGTDAASAAGLAAFAQRMAAGGVSVSLVVRREGGASVAEPEELARWCDLTLLGRLPHSPTLRGDLARGLGPGDRSRAALTRAVRGLAREVGVA